MLITSNLAIAFSLGIFIGLERQWSQNYAGMVTHALVSLGAAAYTAIPALLGIGDAARLGGQVVTGIGFLGAGLIMRDGMSIRGLSAAATVWSTGAVGSLVGYNLRLAAGEVAALVILSNLLLPRVASFIDRYSPEEEYTQHVYVITLQCAMHNEALVRAQLMQALATQRLRLRHLESRTLGSDGVEVHASVHSTTKKDIEIENVGGKD